MSNEVVADSCDIGSSSTCKRGKRETSIVWDTLIKLPRSTDGRLRAQCKVCKKTFLADSKVGTSTMKRHIVEKHISNTMKEHHFEPVDQGMYREKLSKAIVKHNYPFSFVEHQGNKDIHLFLNPTVKTISRNTAKSDMLKMYEREKECLKNEIAAIPSRVCLTSNMWTSLASNGYMCLTAHYVDLDWNLQKRVLIFRHVPPPHSGVVLGPLLIEFLKEWGIEKKIFTLTLDNASCNNGVVDTLKEHLSLMRSLVCDGQFFHVRCGNHILNLIVKEGLGKADEAIAKIREGVKHIKHSEGRILKFVECIKNLGLPCSKKLHQDMVIRWNSTYQMLESAIEYKQAYIQYKLVDPEFKHSLLEDEWERVEKIAEFLKPFYDIIVSFSGSKYPTTNLYLHNVWKIEKRLREAKVGGDPVMSKMATPMLRKFKKYWRSYNINLSLAVILDPRYKLKFVKFCFSKVNPKTAKARVKVIEENLQLLFKEYYVRSTTFVEPGEHSCGSSSNMMRDELDEFDIFESKMDSSIGKTQLDLYLEEPSLDRKTNPKLDVLDFWKDNRLRYPELSLMSY